MVVPSEPGRRLAARRSRGEQTGRLRRSIASDDIDPQSLVGKGG
jgi:hypothetical protein